MAGRSYHIDSAASSEDDVPHTSGASDVARADFAAAASAAAFAASVRVSLIAPLPPPFSALAGGPPTAARPWTTPLPSAPTTASILKGPPAPRLSTTARSRAASTAAVALQLGKAIEVVAKSMMPAPPEPSATTALEAQAAPTPQKEVPAASKPAKANTKAGPTLPLRELFQRGAIIPAANAAAAGDATAAAAAAGVHATFAGRRRPSGSAEQKAWDAMVLAYLIQKEEDRAIGKLGKRGLSQYKWYDEHAASVTKRQRGPKKKPAMSSVPLVANAPAGGEVEEAECLDDREDEEVAEDDGEDGDADKDEVL